MSDRDELNSVNRVLFKYDQLPGQVYGVRGALEDLRSEGWRKMPSREAIASALHADECPDEECEGGDMSDYDRLADVILALMDGGSDDR